VIWRARIETLLEEAAREYAAMIATLPPDLAESIPVDAQGVTEAIDVLAQAAGLTPDERRQLVRPHAVNPAVMHARVFGREPLTRETVVASFVDGARVRADALVVLADRVDAGAAVRAILVAAPPPVDALGPEVIDELRALYTAHERAAITIATALDAV
jgi:hypothetical protein